MLRKHSKHTRGYNMNAVYLHKTKQRIQILTAQFRFKNYILPLDITVDSTIKIQELYFATGYKY